MGKTVTIGIIGVDEIIKDLSKIANSDNVKSAITKATAMVLSTAQANCVVDTGLLKGSLKMSVSDDGEEIIGKVSTSVEYALYVEFGTGIRGAASNYPEAGNLGITYDPTWAGMTARPFMHPAYKQNEKRVKKLIRKAIEESV